MVSQEVFLWLTFIELYWECVMYISSGKMIIASSLTPGMLIKKNNLPGNSKNTILFPKQIEIVVTGRYAPGNARLS